LAVGGRKGGGVYEQRRRDGERWAPLGGRRVAARPRSFHCAVRWTERFQRPLLGHSYLFWWVLKGWGTPGGRWGRARARLSGRTRNRRGGMVATLEAGLGRIYRDVEFSCSGKW